MRSCKSRDINTFWSHINHLTGRKKKSKISGKIALMDWFQHFSSLHDVSMYSEGIRFEVSGPRPKVDSEFLQPEVCDVLDGDFTVEEVTFALTSLKPKKAAGFDGYPPELYKLH